MISNMCAILAAGVGQPDDLIGNQNCGELTESSKINDLDCSSMRMYVCEITRKGMPEI